MDTGVALVKTYLELCGYFVLAELPVRVPDRDGYRDATDLDIVSVRFPHRGTSAPSRRSGPLDLFLDLDPALRGLDEGVDVLIGEVKEGQARLNRALRRADTIAFALRRLGCCPEERVADEAEGIARAGVGELAMPGGLRCRVRLVAFAGYGDAADRGVLTVALGHCSQFIAARLREGRAVLAGVQFKDPVLGLFALEDKLACQAFGDPDGYPRSA